MRFKGEFVKNPLMLSFDPASMAAYGTLLSGVGSLFGGEKAAAPGMGGQELLRLPREQQQEWIQSIMDMLTPGGGMYGTQQRAIAQKQSLDAIHGRQAATRANMMKNYSAAGMAGTPGLQGALQQLQIRGLGEESGAVRDITKGSLDQENQNRQAALGMLGNLYQNRSWATMPRSDENIGGDVNEMNTYKQNRWKWRGSSAY